MIVVVILSFDCWMFFSFQFFLKENATFSVTRLLSLKSSKMSKKPEIYMSYSIKVRLKISKIKRFSVFFLKISCSIPL